MVRRLQVYWINAISVGDERRITHVAGRYPDGSRWELSAEEASIAMRDRALSLYIIRNGDIHDLVANVAEGQPYLSCSGGAHAQAQLLALPAFHPGQRFLG